MKGIYRHKKGNIYRVLFEAKHSETLEDLVIYQEVNDETKIWARPKSMFLDKGRFTKIDDNIKETASPVNERFSRHSPKRP